MDFNVELVYSTCTKDQTNDDENQFALASTGDDKSKSIFALEQYLKRL